MIKAINNNKKLFLLLGILFSAVIRLVWLWKIPAGISDDELFFVLSAKSFYYSGKDLAQTTHLLSPYIPPFSYAPFARTAPILVSPVIGPLPLNLFTARLPYAVLGILFVFILYGISEKLFSSSVARVICILAILNPWSIIFFRTSFEAPVAVFLIYTTIYLLLTLPNRFYYLTYPVFLLGLYSYMGSSLIIFFYLIPVFFYRIRTSKNTRPILLWIFIFFFTWLAFVMTLQYQNAGNRISELFTPNHESIASQVIRERTVAINTPFSYIFSNKYFAFTRILLEKYFGAFSPTLLLTNGESRTTFSLWVHGLFYYTDGFFILMGLILTYNKYRRSFWMLIAMAAISPLPAAISNLGNSFALRSALLYPVLIILSGAGAYQTVIAVSTKFRALLITVLVIIFGVLFLNFSYIYLFRNVINNSEAFGVSGRILSRYIKSAQALTENVYVIDAGPSRELFNQYLFYNNRYIPETVAVTAYAYNTNQYIIDNVHYVSCPKKRFPDNSTVIIKFGIPCNLYDEDPDVIYIPYLADSGVLYKIYSDNVCKREQLNPYVSNFSWKNLDIESLPVDVFCSAYLTKALPD